MRVSHSSRPRSVRAAAILSVAIVALTAVTAAAPASAAGFAPRTVDAADATPHRIVLTPPEHPDTSQSFTWRTGAEVIEGAVTIREVGATGWSSFDARANEELLRNDIPTRTHSVTVENLTPATEYEYYVGTDGAESETYRFTTAGQPGEDFTFIYFGDAQNDVAAKWTPVVKQAFEAYPDAIGTVNAGDLINNSDRDTEWTDWFGAMDGYSQTSNVIAAPGNHEYSGDSFLRAWKSNFEYPATGPQATPFDAQTPAELQKQAYEEHMAAVLTETAYYTDYQGVRFIALNASRSQAGELMTPDDLPFCLIGCPDPIQLWLDIQADWLDSILENNPSKWAVAVFHQPVFSTAEGRDEADVRDAWLPVFQSNDIDLVLMGHDHTYARGYVNADATETPGMTTGPVYAVSVSGPKYYEQQPVDNNVWTQNGATQVVRAGHTSTFQGVHVSGNQLRYESIVAAKWDDESTTDKEIGEVLDSFTITKYDDGTKWVTEDGVPIPAEGEGNPEEPGEEPAPEEPGEEPADAPLGHEVVGSIDSPTVPEPGPNAINVKDQVLYVADRSADGNGLVEAIDLETGSVIDSFELPAPVHDMIYQPELASVIASFGDSTIGAYSTAPQTFGQPIVDDIPIPGAQIRGVSLDAARGLVFVALENGFLLTLDAEEGELVGDPLPVGAAVQRIKVDSTSGVLYATFDNAEDGDVALRLYATRNNFDVVKEYELDAGASSVAFDSAEGLVYVGHRTDGLSVVDLVDDSVVRLDSEFGNAVEGVSVDSTKGLSYVSNSTGEPAAITVVGRWQAPRVVTAPAAVTVDPGTQATFSAAGFGVPAPAVHWESRAAGTNTWVPVGGATGSLEIEAALELHGTQYRAVFTNTIEGTEYSTRSATATLRVNGATEEPEEPEEPGDEQPTGTPAPVADSSLTDATRGGVTVSCDDRECTMSVGEQNAGEWIGVYLHSDPVFLGWVQADDSGQVEVSIPAGTAAGAHKLVALDADGEVLGWAPVQVAAAASADDPLASTGAAPLGAFVLGLMLLGLGGMVTAARLRSRSAG